MPIVKSWASSQQLHSLDHVVWGAGERPWAGRNTLVCSMARDTIIRNVRSHCQCSGHQLLPRTLVTSMELWTMRTAVPCWRLAQPSVSACPSSEKIDYCSTKPTYGKRSRWKEGLTSISVLWTQQVYTLLTWLVTPTVLYTQADCLSSTEKAGL